MNNDFSNIKLALFDFDGVFTDNNVYITVIVKKLIDVIEVTVLAFQELKR